MSNEVPEERVEALLALHQPGYPVVLPTVLGRPGLGLAFRRER
jgi:hypothetical protein